MTAHLFYQEKIDSYTESVQSFKRKIAVSAILRLLLFAAFAVSAYFFFKHWSTGLLLISLLFFVAFLLLVWYALRLKEKKALLEKLLFINANELGVLNNEPNRLDNGSSFANGKGYAEDLDIFGPRSLFHLLNRCTTAHGREYLATLLREPLTDPAGITARQQAVQFMSDQPDKRQLITAHGLLHAEAEGNLHSIAEWLQPAAGLHKKKWLQAVRWALPSYTIPSFLYYIATGNILYAGVGIAATWLITARYAKYIHRQHQLISKKQSILEQYAGILKTFVTVETGSSSVLKQLQQTAGNAHSAIGTLAKLSSFFDQRLNLLVNIFLNSLAMYDMQCILALEQWKERHKNNFGQWLLAVGDIECLNALACFAFNNPHFAYPQVDQSETLYIKANQMAHPLISAAECVVNDFEAGKSSRLLLVTGSNMSGKTTFLRTLGVNLILAQSGAPVCAAAFIFTPMEILTSIRVNDSLQEHTSYFMAELKRLQQIILQLRQNKPALVLIDEILRGTNSEDKTHGSEQFIKQLLRYNCITLFATHDLALAPLENEYEGMISNYCFESILQNNTLHFDYKLRAGVAKNKNASFLMKQMGIIEGEK
jgi:DNA mismatch repair ATPase MutS